MRRRDATTADLEVVASWICSQCECELWAGSGVRFPPEPDALAVQIDLANAASICLFEEQGLAAFGQLLFRTPKRVHLARVIVRPDVRGRGIGRSLVQELLSRAAESGSLLVTLNVYRDNAAAIALYGDLGFRRAERLEDDPPSSGTWFMTRSIEPLAPG